MARLTKIVRSNPLSSFTQVTPAAGAAFGLIADALETLNERVQPVAEKRLKLDGDQRGRRAGEAARPATNAARNVAMRDYGGPTNAAASALGGAGQTVRAGLIRRGLPEHIADAFVMNFQDESGLNSGINEANPIVPGSRGGFGLAQWTGPRRRQLEAFASARGTPVSDMDTQLDFLMSELEGSESAAAQSILSAPDAGSAAAAIVNQFLRPSEQHRARREAKYLGGTSMPVAQDDTPSVQVRTKGGQIELRKYSEFSGPLLQMDTIAAQSAYQDTILNQSAIDLSEMRLQFEYDPSGFAQTARTYVDEIIKAAPDDMRGVLRAELETEVQRTVLGIQADKSKLVRQRASNANSALMDRFNTEYSDALVSGDPEAIAQAEQRLNGVLRVRESLPGSTWTIEDSAGVLFNTRRAASIEAQRQQEREFKAFRDDTKDRIELVIKSIKAGRVGEGEALLDDPMAEELHPELVREGRRFRGLREAMPNFNQMTPDQMDETVAGMASVEVQEEWQIDIVEAAGKVASDARKAWEDDPVKRASETLVSQPPDIITAAQSGDLPAVLKAMTDRRAYMNDLRQKGYFDTPTFFSKEEAEALKAMFTPEIPADERMSMAAGLAAAFKSDAAHAFDQSDAAHAFDQIDGDKTTMFAGKLLSRGGSHAVASEIITGKDLMREGIAKMPEKTTFGSVFNENFGSVFNTVKFPAGVKGEIIEAAQAIYASRSASADMSDADARDTLMVEAMNAALGAQKTPRGKTTGGVQEVLGVPTLVPIGVTGDEIERAINSTFRFRLPGEAGVMGAIKDFAVGMRGDGLDPDMTSLVAASDQGVPLFNGKPLDARTLRHLEISVQAAGEQTYYLVGKIGNQTIELTGPGERRYAFKMDKFLEAAR